MIYFLAILIAAACAFILSTYAGGALGLSRAPRLALCACVAAGAAVGWFAYTRSTSPSFAPRITLTGKALDCVNVHRFSRNRHLFRFEPASGDRVFLQTKILAPMCFSSSITFDDRTYRVIYLEDPKRSMSREVTSIDVVSGTDTGWHEALDARPFGTWLGVPIGAFLVMLGLAEFRGRRKHDPKR